MSVKEIKDQLASLPRKEQDEVAAYLFHLRHKNDPGYQREVQDRLDDKAPAHWLNLEDFEKELDRRK